MSDDQWRRRPEDEDDFGGPLFGDEPASGTVRRIPPARKELAKRETEAISFGDSDAVPLQHWSEPATGELPVGLGAGSEPDPTDDLDVWSSFSGNTAKWPDDSSSADLGRSYAEDPDDITGLHPIFEDAGVSFDEPTPVGRDVPPVRREQGRITIGTDPTDGLSTRSSSTSSPPSRRTRPDTAPRGTQPRGAQPRGAQRPRPPGAGRPAPKASAGTAGRDMPTAIAVGLVLAAIFVGAVKYKPWAVAVIVVIVLGLAAIEYFDRVREKGYEPAYIPGIVACFTAPIAVYHYGVGSLPLVMFLAVAACAVTFIGATSIQSNPMPNMAITILAIAWIGVLGSFGAAILNIGNFGIFTADGFSTHVGTDTLCLMAIAVVANDVGALFVGSAVGRTPLREWISPNKSIEGFVGGTILTLGAMFLVGVWGKSTSWNSDGDLLLLGAVVSVMAPIGDLTESMFKRNLDVKDFGSIIKGHGGVLDRFDGFLFVMPAVYFLLIHLQPWVTK